jgi:CRP-like cAMP-binding protein
VLAMPGPHEFFGEASLVNQSVRISTAAALEPATLLRVEKQAMIRSLHEQGLIDYSGELTVRKEAHIAEPVETTQLVSIVVDLVGRAP